MEMETNGYLFSNVSIDALVLKHQAISTHSADKQIHQSSIDSLYKGPVMWIWLMMAGDLSRHDAHVATL